MKLDRELFDCNTEAVVSRLEELIRRHTERMGRRGAAVGISGGVDSSVVATLCARALGPQRVHGLVLTEKQGNPDADRYARHIAAWLGVRRKRIDITPVLRKLGVYRFITGLVPSRRVAGWMVRRYMASYEGNPYLDHKRGTDRPLIHRGFAMIDTKHRVRLVYALRYAERKNLLLVGCAHKSESMLGLYVKFGIDDSADLMPLGNLYRSHVLRLARYLGIPGEIISRPPSPDVLPGIEDKYRDVLDLPSETVDLVLVGLEAGLPADEIETATGVSADKIGEVAGLVSDTYHMREHGIAADIPDEELWGSR